MHTRQKIGIALGILFFLSFLTYAGFEAQKLIFGPQISINTPYDGETFTDQSAIIISGTTKNAAFLTLDNRQIFSDTGGHWSENFVLLPGYNIITVAARDRYGKIITKILHLYLVKTNPSSPQFFTGSSTGTLGKKTSQEASSTNRVSTTTKS